MSVTSLPSGRSSCSRSYSVAKAFLKRLLGNTHDIARSSYVRPRVIEHYLEGSVVARQVEQLEEVILAEQGDLTEEEQALLDLLKKKLRRELEQAA